MTLNRDSAQHPAEGPIATIKLPMRLRQSLHGNWVPGGLSG
jgi:carotenoid cleavage dioxygenase-like enzyme